MLKTSDTSRKLLFGTAVYSAVFFALGLVFCVFLLSGVPLILPFFIGVLGGVVFSAVKLILLERVLNKSLDMEPAYSQNYVRLHFILRYILTGAMLAVAIMNSPACFVGVVLGLFSMQLSAYSIGFIEKRRQYPTRKE